MSTNINLLTPSNPTQHSKVQKGLSPFALARRKFLNNKLAMVCLVFLLVIIVASFASPLYLPKLAQVNKINPILINKTPSLHHWLGTDQAGRDVLKRLLYGGRSSLTVGLSITIIVTLVGSIIGATAGYFGGIIDDILMRFTDFMLNFPFLLFVIALSAAIPGSGIGTLIITISVLAWPGVARMVRGKIMVEKENEYILAAVSTGNRPLRIILRHALPNVVSTIIVQATLILANMIVVETGLSFLGFGISESTPSWGNMMQAATNPDTLQNMLWIWVPPAIIIISTILSINFIGEGLKDAFNPKSHR